ncbi:hypothetical protein DSO57_1007421 [Entomophthora muscae]|uniref:Uncharacterized protein n=1 Tax=Entomophthora muscae TaxID=34485 RepID=A0ACC2T7B7_9FUNG|nr:hypothetical protein DSO57_1007421 [Entomophthora muscae]
MQAKQDGILFTVDESCAKVVCDQCRLRHTKCDRRSPTCGSCTRYGVICTHNNAKKRHEEIGLHQLQLLVRTKTAPLTWAHAISNQSKNPHTLYFLRRYLLPLELILPKPTQAAEILQLNIHSLTLSPYSTITNKQLQPTFDAIQAKFFQAIKTFFRLFNPFYPLFSEEGFFSRPRSAVLIKTVIQIGLERMPKSSLTRAAVEANNLDPTELERLPVSLDTVQCHLLVLFGLWDSRYQKAHLYITLFACRFISLLGLHVDTSSLWLERKLAFQMHYYAFCHKSLGQIISLKKIRSA